MTDVALREYLERLIEEVRERDDARWDSHRREHEMLKQALDAAYNSQADKLEQMNEMRTQILSERGEFLKKGEYNIAHEQLETRLGKVENKDSNLDGRFWMLGTVLVGLSIVFPLLLRYLVK